VLTRVCRLPRIFSLLIACAIFVRDVLWIIGEALAATVHDEDEICSKPSYGGTPELARDQQQ
jgi:hypothetical protein